MLSDNNIFVLMTLIFSLCILLLLVWKLIFWLNIFKHIERKHGQLVLDAVRSLEQVKRKCFKVSQDIIFIKNCQNGNRLPMFARMKLGKKSRKIKSSTKSKKLLWMQNYIKTITKNANSNVKLSNCQLN